jgi:hypothetical protein
MKSLRLLILGLVSSALLTVGLSRIASHVDPLAKQVAFSNKSILSAPPCSTPCIIPT